MAHPTLLVAAMLFAAATAQWPAAAPLLPDPACPNVPLSVPTGSFLLLGEGRCVDRANATATAFTCVSAPCPRMADVAACVQTCAADPGCTGFELRPADPSAAAIVTRHANGNDDDHDDNNDDDTSNATTCFVFLSAEPSTGNASTWPWAQVNGTQLRGNGSSGRAVVRAGNIALALGNSGSSSSCCYKRAYPLHNPADNPIVVPTGQSARQRAVFANASARAREAAAAARPALVELVDFCAAAFSAKTCPGMADVGPRPNSTQVLTRFAGELRGVDFGHGFRTLVKSPTPSSFLFSESYELLLNLWEPQLVGLNNDTVTVHGEAVWDAVQREIFGCAPFTGQTNLTPANFSEAADRIVYTAMNYWRGPLGNSVGFGGFAAVMRPDFVQDKILFTPTDSAKYHSQFPNCTVWPGCVAGTVQHFEHILLSWMALSAGVYPPPHDAARCAAQMDILVKMVCPVPLPRVLGPYPPMTNVTTPPVAAQYWEADVLGTVRYSEGVQLIGASFNQYFGTPLGAALQQWCLRHGWILAWVLYPLSNAAQQGTAAAVTATYNNNAAAATVAATSREFYSDPRRMLDPRVAPHTTANATVTEAFAEAFESAWVAAAAAWAAEGANPHSATQWRSLADEAASPGAGHVLLWNARAADCGGGDEGAFDCIGVTHSTGACVCYQRR